MPNDPSMTPEREHELAVDLDKYTDPMHPEYDPAFTAKLKKTRPDWFEDDKAIKWSRYTHRC